MSVNVEFCSDREEWDRMVRNSPQGSIFHTWDWLKIVEKHTSSKLLPLVGLKGSTPIGIYPLFIKKRYTIKIALSPPPYTAIPYLGPALIDYDRLKEDKKLINLRDLQNAVDDYLRSINAKFVMVNLHRNLVDCRPFKWNGYSLQPLFHYTLSLNGNVWGGFKKEFRENVKKSKKKGLYVEEGDVDDLKFIYASLKRIYESQNRKTHLSMNYLEDVFERFNPNNLKVFVAKHDGKILQGIVVLCFKDTIQFWVGGAKSSVKGVYPNEFLHWEVMSWAMENGFKEFEEFGAGTERLAMFKSKFNPKLNVCFRAKKSCAFFGLSERIYRILRNWVRI